MNQPDEVLSLSEIICTERLQMQGAHLVEASAGTGKTYCIETLYLRMVIVHGLPVQKILVVTFTEAATHELRDRLRKILHKAAQELAAYKIDGMISDKRIRDLIALPLSGDTVGYDPASEQLTRIQKALRDFDLASIHTIHGFCNTVLKRYAFECGQPFGLELVGDDDTLLMQVCADWWRKVAYVDGAAIASLISFDKLLEAAGAIYAQQAAMVLPELTAKDYVSAQHAFAAAVENLRNKIDTGLLEKIIPKGSWRNPGRSREVELLNAFKEEGVLTDGLINFVTTKLKYKLDKVAAKDPHAYEEVEAIWQPYIEMLNARRLLMPAAAVEIAENCGRLKRQQNLITYDDLILNLYRAMQSPEYGDKLCAILQNEYDAALIDEFQDTDPFQYTIFYNAFIRDSARPVFLVGDPKQAIYAFRNGDIFTYFAAKENKPRPKRYTLDTNYRSVKRMIEAVNTVFQDRFIAGDEATSIDYDGTLKANGKQTNDGVEIALVDPNGGAGIGVFQIWYYDSCEDGRTLTTADKPRYQTIFREQAQEARRLLDDTSVRIGGFRVEPADIAFLVGSHAEAQSVYDHLRALRIPAIRQSSGNIFATAEAKDVAVLLRAIAEPANATAIRSALATELFPIDDKILYQFIASGIAASSAREIQTGTADHNDDCAVFLQTWENVLEAFRQAKEDLVFGSLIKAVTRLFTAFGVQHHLLSSENGERRITNLMQLVELIHNVSLDRNLGLEGTVDWLMRQLDKRTRDHNDAFELRLESDARAVRIMTVFKSKGLEFPIVFMPTLALRHPRNRSGKINSFHRKENGQWKQCLDLEGSAESVEALRIEQELENRRLFYVAATRAVYRSYLVWGNFRKPENDDNPLSVVFRKNAPQIPDGVSAYEAEKQRCPHLFADGCAVTVENHGRPAPFDRSLLFSSAPTETGSENAGKAPDKQLRCWKPEGMHRIRVDKSRRHSSYSGIAPAHQHEAVLRDVDEGDALRVQEDLASAGGIFSFTGGKKVGTCWHEVFEQIDFAAWSKNAESEKRNSSVETINTVLDRYQILDSDENEAENQRRIIYQMVEDVLSAEMSAACGNTFCLHEIELADRRAEVDFDFPLPRWKNNERRTGLFLKVLQKYWGDDPQKGAFVQSLTGWDRIIPQGYMTGFIDLLFRHKGRYYILDWKSNRRGGRPTDFDENGLVDEMAEHAYYLQYLIYLVATHQYLRGCLPDYEYDTHIGGVFYLFLRGVDPKVPGRGIYSDLPPKQMIEALSDVLGEFAQ